MEHLNFVVIKSCRAKLTFSKTRTNTFTWTVAGNTFLMVGNLDILPLLLTNHLDLYEYANDLTCFVLFSYLCIFIYVARTLLFVLTLCKLRRPILYFGFLFCAFPLSDSPFFLFSLSDSLSLSLFQSLFLICASALRSDLTLYK